MDEEEIVDFAQLPCLRCRQQMVYVGQLPLRTGGLRGIMSELGQLFEEVFELYTYRCSNCQKVEFYDLDSKLPTPPTQEFEE